MSTTFDNIKKHFEDDYQSIYNEHILQTMLFVVLFSKTLLYIIESIV